MNVLSKEARAARKARDPRSVGSIGRSDQRAGHQQARAIGFDSQHQEMRWIGVGLCMISAMITLASATLIALQV